MRVEAQVAVTAKVLVETAVEKQVLLQDMDIVVPVIKALKIGKTKMVINYSK